MPLPSGVMPADVIPIGALGDTTTRVLLAVIEQRRPSVRSVAAAVDRSPASTHRHLARLCRAGLVRWEHDTAGTLRTTVRPVGS